MRPNLNVIATMRARRLVGGSFDAAYYLERNSDVAAAGGDPLKHYLSIGWRERRDPAPWFSVSEYLAANPDVAAAGQEPFQHYLRLGRNEGRSLSGAGRLPAPAQEDRELVRSAFDVNHYLRSNPDLKALEIEPLEHFLTWGWREGRDPVPWFSTRDYLAARPELARADVNPFAHFLRNGGRPGVGTWDELRGSRAHDLVRQNMDHDWYLRTYKATDRLSEDPALHYLATGWRLAFDPAPWFSTVYYLEHNPDVAAAGVNPFVHYLDGGRAEGRKPIRGVRGHDLAFDPVDESPLLALPTALAVDDEAPPLSWAPRIAVHLHAYHVEVAPTILAALAALPGPFTLFVSSDAREKLGAVKAMAEKRFPGFEARYEVTPNRGRDVAPLLVTFGETLKDYDLLLHVHTKVSKEKPEVGERWLRHSLRGLLSDSRYVSSLINLFAVEPDCGFLFPPAPAEIVPFMGWGRNKPLAERLLNRLGLDPTLPERPDAFPAGFMFWCRPRALAPLLSARFRYEDFPAEPIEDDGTVAHTIERCVVSIAARAGFPSHYRVEPLPAQEVPAGRGTDVAVVIPLYNVGPEFHGAVQSVLRQRRPCPTAQIVLVDNGSTDGTRERAAFYASCFPNIELHDEPTKGAGAARNTGIAAAECEYATLLDGDDVLSRTALRDLAYTASRHEAEVVVSPLHVFDEVGFSPPLPHAYSASDTVVDVARLATPGTNYEVTPRDSYLLASLFTDFGACAKLYRRDYLQKAALRFPEGTNFEDNAFAYSAYLGASTLACCPASTYYYRKLSRDAGKTQSRQKTFAAASDFLAVHRELLDRAARVDNAHLRALMLEGLHQRLEQYVGEKPLLTLDGGLRTALAGLRADIDVELGRAGFATSSLISGRSARPSTSSPTPGPVRSSTGESG